MRKTLIALSLLASTLSNAAAAESVFEFDLRMQRIDKVSQSVMKNIEKNDSDAATKDANSLAEMYSELETYFGQRDHGEDAVRMSREGKDQAAKAAGLAARHEFEAAFKAVKNVTGDCRACHVAYDPL